jgi:hypothetical protein
MWVAAAAPPPGTRPFSARVPSTACAWQRYKHSSTPPRTTSGALPLAHCRCSPDIANSCTTWNWAGRPIRTLLVATDNFLYAGVSKRRIDSDPMGLIWR